MGYVIEDELHKILDSVEYEEFGEAYLSHIRQDSSGLRLVFDIQSGTDATGDSTWLIRVENVYISNLWIPDPNYVFTNHPRTFRAVETGLEFTNDHPVVLAYTQPRASLSITGKADNVGHLLLELASAHERLFSPYIDNLLANPRAVDVLLAGYGILAFGPEVVLTPYIEILTAHGVACRLNTSTLQPEPRAVALLMNRGFVVSEYMWAERIL
jgi:hypothetical protein